MPRRVPLVVAGAVLVGGVALGGFLVARENAVGTPAAETSPTVAVVTDGADDGVAGTDGDGAPRTVVSPPPSDPADTWPATNVRTTETGSVPANTITSDMRREIDRVIAAGRNAARVSPSAGARSPSRCGSIAAG